MRVERFPFKYDFRKRFPQSRRVGGFEGGAVYAAEKSDKFYLIVDEGTMADFILPEDEDLLDQLVQVIDFDTEDECQHYIKEKYWYLR